MERVSEPVRDVLVCDVAPRDGLQNEPVVLPPAVRIALVEQLRAAGLGRIEAVSFVRDERVPAMAGAEQVVAATGVEQLAGLVLNERGYERLHAAGLRTVHVGVSVTDTFGRRNANRGLEDGLVAAEAIVRRARADGLAVTTALIVAFGCPFEGRVDPGVVLEAAQRMVAAGADEIALADTIGVAVPRQVARLVTAVRLVTPRVGVHLHDTRNTAIANAWAALEAGASVIDAAAGGIGGCPFAPRATGNVATEDLLYLLEGEGVRTGVDLDAVIAVAHRLGELLGRELPGRVARAGRFVALANPDLTEERA